MSSNKKISDLSEDTGLSLADFVPIVSAGATTTRKANLARILALAGSGGGSGSGGGGTMLDAFTIAVPGNTLGLNGHQVNIGDSVSALLKLILSPVIATTITVNSPGIQLPATGGNLSSAVTITAGTYAIQSVTYSFISGPAAGSVSQAGVFAGFTVAGTYHCSVQVTDVNGSTVTADITVVVSAAAVAPTFTTALNIGDSADGVTLAGLTGLQFKFNSPLPAGDPLPASMGLFIAGTQVGAVSFNSPAIGQPCQVIYNGSTYNTTFQNNDTVTLN